VHAQKLIRLLTQGRALFSQITLIIFEVVEELVSRLRCSTFLWTIIDTLYRGASIDAADFFNIPKKVVNVIVGG